MLTIVKYKILNASIVRLEKSDIVAYTGIANIDMGM